MRLHALVTMAAMTAAAVLVSPSSSLAQDAERYAPKRPPQKQTPSTLPAAKVPPKSKDREQLVAKLNGIIFVNDASKVRKQAAEKQGLTFDGVPLLDSPDFRPGMRARLGKPLTMAELNDIAREVVLFYRAEDRPVVDAIVPEQDVTNGYVQILVQEGHVGQVKVEENKHFSSDRLRGYVRAQSGDAISSEETLSDLDWINRNPFRRVDLAFERGGSAGETDLVLLTQDRFPLRVYGGYENTGTESTGQDRLLAGFNWGDAFGLDHQLNYQFTTSPDYDKFNTHWGSYVVPLPWRHELTLLGAFTRTQPEVETGFNEDGESWQTSARYEIPLKRHDAYEHSLTLGFDFKRSNNNLEFGGSSVFGTDTDIAQWSIGYGGMLPDRYGQTRGNITLYYSPGGMTSNNSDEAFQVARDGAESSYIYALLNLQRDTNLPGGFTWVARGAAQISDGPLLGSEQLGFGGATSVRGYEERQGNGDKGWMISNEIYTPSISVANMVGARNVKDSLRFLAFVDYGVAYDESPSAPDSTAIFASVGPGVRYSLSNYLTVQYDYGFQLTDANQDDRHTGRHHLSVLMSYSF